MEQPLLPKLLIRCLCPDVSDDILAKLGQLSAPEWSRLIIWAAKQQVETLFYARLQQCGREALLPDSVRKRLQSFYQVDTNRNSRLVQPLGELLTELRQAHIPIIVFRDAYLAETVYNHFALRRINEFDLLVAPDHLPAAVEKLQRLGYQALGTARSTKAHLLLSPLPRFIKAGLLASVVLHRTLTPATALVDTIDMPAVWQRALPIKLAGLDTLGLAHEDQVLYLAAQAIQHQLLLRGLSTACDLNLFIQRQQAQINWSTVQERATAWQWDKEVHLAFSLVKTLMDAPIPEAAIQALQPPDYSEELLHQAMTHLFADGWQSTSPNPALPVWGYHQLLRQGYKLLQHLRLARSTPSHV